MAKRGYTRDTIRGGASDWDVSRPFSSYLRMLGGLVAHPVRFFEVLPRLPATALWFLFGGLYPALAALLVPLPLSLPVAGLYHLGSIGGRYGYLVTWRTVAYPFGFYLPLSAVPVARWVAAVYAGAVLLGVGLATVREIGVARAALASVMITALLVLAAYLLVAR